MGLTLTKGAPLEGVLRLRGGKVNPWVGRTTRDRRLARKNNTKTEPTTHQVSAATGVVARLVHGSRWGLSLLLYNSVSRHSVAGLVCLIASLLELMGWWLRWKLVEWCLQHCSRMQAAVINCAHV